MKCSVKQCKETPYYKIGKNPLCKKHFKKIKGRVSLTEASDSKGLKTYESNNDYTTAALIGLMETDSSSGSSGGGSSNSCSSVSSCGGGSSCGSSGCGGAGCGGA